MTSDKNFSTPVKWLLFLAGILIVIAAAVVAYQFNERSSLEGQQTIPLTKNISLGLAAILTPENPRYEISPLRARLYDKLPRRWKRTWRISGLPVARGAEWHFYGSSGQSQLALYYRVPENWSNNHRRVESELKNFIGSDTLYLMADYGNGWCSDLQTFTSFAFDSYTDVPGVSPIYDTSSFPIPASREYYDVLLLKSSQGRQITSEAVIGSFRIRNPQYRNVEPLQRVQALPISVTHGDVTVTLKALASKVQEDSIWEDRERWRADPGRMDGDDFVRAEGSLTDRYFGMAVFTIDEAGTSKTQWTSEYPKFAYGKRQVKFPIYPYSLDNLDEGWNIFGYENDPGMLQQPVNIKVTLKRARRFPADEIQTVEIPIPAAGTTAFPGTTVKFWAGAGTVGAVYKQTTEVERSSAGTSGAITLIRGGSAEDADIQEIKLVSTGGRELDLARAEGGASGTSNYTITDYFPGHVKKWFWDNEEHLAEDTTLTVTLVHPRTYPHTFEFTAEPVEATGRKQFGGWLGELMGW